ncbi:MAG TPA: hypothetical protein VK100_07555 [Pseudogracilibacillus sp.]|nr:hypothetical protein [Pseudogracilibacillus sp.]
MKKYLTTIFIFLGILSIVFGYQLDVRWNGIVSWGLALIFFLFAAYFTRYISSDKKEHCGCEEENT